MPLKPCVSAVALPFASVAGYATHWRAMLAAVTLVFAASALAPAAQAAGSSEAGQSKPGVNAPKATKSPKSANTGKSANTSKSATARAGSKASPKAKRRSAMSAAPARPSYGQIAGLHATPDDLALKSSVALVIDQDTQEVLLQKNQRAVLPIASLTKLMTGTIISEAKLPMDEMITITQDDVDTEKGSGSRLRVGAALTRAEAMHLALMASENRAAHALGRTYPGGLSAFVSAMNAKARQLGMQATTYVEPTGLSSRNQSSAQDLAILVAAAAIDPMLREYSTSHGAQVAVGKRVLQYNNTNRLVKNPDWDIGLQKTGYISEAGQCLVMQARIAGRKVIIVFLDSAGKLSRLGDAERVRRWVEHNAGSLRPTGALPTRTSSAVPGANG
jgi:D-alanyl-D-alanine endopeptidase (penicillin-binding protein 7)